MSRNPKAFTVIQDLRNRGKGLQLSLSLLYLVLSMAAAWHNHRGETPRFSSAIHGGIATDQAIASSTSEGPGQSADLDGFCALCAWQSLQQETTSATSAVQSFFPLATTPAPSILAAPTPGFSQASWARGPPSV